MLFILLYIGKNYIKNKHIVGDFMLQSRINELYSGIIDLKENETHVTGFYNADRLTSHLESGISNFSSKGIYPNEPINFNDIQTNALFIVKKHNEVIEKYQFKLIYKQLAQPTNRPNKIILNIRKDMFSTAYNVQTESNSDIFDSFENLTDFLVAHYKNGVQIVEQLKEKSL